MFGPFFLIQQFFMEFLCDVLQSTCPSKHIPFSHHKIDMKAKGVVMVRASSSTGQTNVPLPVFSKPNAAPPVGRHGKFQLEMRNSHEALRT